MRGDQTTVPRSKSVERPVPSAVGDSTRVGSPSAARRADQAARTSVAESSMSAFTFARSGPICA